MGPTINYSIIIPSFGRPDMLAATVESLSKSKIHWGDVEIIIVDNGDRESEIIAPGIPIRCIKEPQRGSSDARNTGILNAKGEWLLFLDDDVNVPEQFYQKFKEICQRGEYHCFGGMYYPWYPKGDKPKWMPADFGKKECFLPKAGVITPGIDGFLSAGIMAAKKTAILSVGMFNPSLGMGVKIGYGEEDDLQIKLHSAGYRLGFDPDWWLYHAVLPHKFKLRWHIKSTFARARDSQKINKPYELSQVLYYLIGVTVSAPLKRIPKAIKSLMREDNYYWQNAYLDIVLPWVEWIGRLSAFKLR